MLGWRGKVPNANNVIHLIVEQVVDLTADLKKVSDEMANFRSRPGVAMKT